MPKIVSPWRLALAFAGLLLCAAAASAQTSVPCNLTTVRACVHLRDDSQLLPTTAAPLRRLPVLFVHGHNTNSANDADFNYQQNWQDTSRVSFKPTLELPDNAGLDIEDYYIRFENQEHSISEDATDISDAIDLILHRHDPAYAYPYVAGQTTNVKVVIIAYSKGTLSTRLYLKSLGTNIAGLPAPRPGFNPVSEFIAISPPNHGVVSFGTTCAAQQLMNGRSALGCNVFGQPLTPSPASCGSFPAGGLDFITNLNTPDEAPGSRPATNISGAPTPPTQGTLYLTIFADASNPDLVGGLNPPSPNPCMNRPMAANLSPNAVNVTLPIAGANSAEVHGNTPHTPLVICKALFAAVHHRSPVAEDCALPANATNPPVVPPPARAAAMLSLDFSGSMSLRECATCQTRAEMLQDAVRLFLELWSAVSVPTDRIGVNYFRTNVDDSFIVSGDPVPLLSDGKDLIITSLNSQGANNRTAMGGGIKRAVEVLQGLTDTPPIRRVILFTDGMQNVNPMVLDQNNQLVIQNEVGRLNSNVPETPMVTLNTSLGIAVDTIGIGAGEAFVGLLQRIATDTGGRTWPTSDPAFDLRRFFVESLINALKGFSPQLVAYRRGTLGVKGSSEAFAIEAGARKLVLKLSSRRGNAVDFSVERNGVDVTSAGRLINGPFYKIFVIDFPNKRKLTSHANWVVKIKGKATTGYEAAAIVDGEHIKFDAGFGGKRFRVGDPLELVVRLTAAGKLIPSRTRVMMTLTRPAEVGRALAGIKPTELGGVRSLEPGLSIDQQKQLGLFQKRAMLRALQPKLLSVVMQADRKGEYRARVLPRIAGIYTAVITIDGEVEKLGRFSRTMTAVTVVRSR